MTKSENIVRGGSEVVPRFYIITSEGDWTLFVPLPDALRERERRMRLVAGFMAWKMATAFLLAGEIHEPDAITVTYVSRNNAGVALREIRRNPISFEEMIVLGKEAIGDEVLSLLPPIEAVLFDLQVAELKRAFGEGSEIEAQRVN